MSADQRPAETAAREHAAAEAQLAMDQMRGPGGHAAAVMAPFPGIAVADRTDSRLTPADLPDVPGQHSKHTGGDDAGYPA